MKLPFARSAEYSKRILSAMIALWFAGALFGGVIVTVQAVRDSYYIPLDALLSYIGYPMGGGIIGYLIKSALENREKIKNNPNWEDKSL